MQLQYDAETFTPLRAAHKKPFGAVTPGTDVTLCVTPRREAGVTEGSVALRYEQDGDRTEVFPLRWTGTDYTRDRFEAVCPVREGYVGLIWYRFTLAAPREEPSVSGDYQLTVYDGRENVPDWFGRGVTYQIFPDRFCRTAVPDPAGMVGGRTVHADWNEEPVYKPDAQGQIRNRDFFGGSLAGVREKLPYLASLGVETIYFNPIFEAAENHRYGTADYEKIDPMLGTEDEFRALCDEAHQLGMHVMLDGVFNHTGSVSRYFNEDGFYPEPGAYQSRESRYFGWYCFSHWPDEYASWWGIRTLPETNEADPSWRSYVQDEIVPKWLEAGADAWRLDVADELSDEFIAGIHASARKTKPDAIVLGEVWEDGSNKIAYSVRRKHILGCHCDGLMNYPFRNALLGYLLGGKAEDFRNAMETLREHYPPFAWRNAMNFLGTHDVPRILTLLGEGGAREDRSRDWRAQSRLSPAARQKAIELLKVGSMIQFAFPGSPCIYYGDEAGMEGFEDPFNRRTFPWGRENAGLLEHYRTLGMLRKTERALREGDICCLKAEGPVLAFTRTAGEDCFLCAANAGSVYAVLPLPFPAETAAGSADLSDGEIGLAPRSAVWLRRVPAPEEDGDGQET